MAEGGEGEDEIQFLRTVSKDPEKKNLREFAAAARTSLFRSLVNPTFTDEARDLDEVFHFCFLVYLFIQTHQQLGWCLDHHACVPLLLVLKLPHVSLCTCRWDF